MPGWVEARLYALSNLFITASERPIIAFFNRQVRREEGYCATLVEEGGAFSRINFNGERGRFISSVRLALWIFYFNSGAVIGRCEKNLKIEMVTGERKK